MFRLKLKFKVTKLFFTRTIPYQEVACRMIMTLEKSS